MTEFIVTHKETNRVEAENEEEAVEKAISGEVEAYWETTRHQVEKVDSELIEVDRMVESRGSDRQSAFFYGNQDEGTTAIAEAEDQNGNLYQLVTTGEIRVKVNGEIYRNKEIPELIEEKGLTDSDLNSEEIEFMSNNWFEVVWQNDDGSRWNSEIGIRHTYEEGIAMLREYAKKCYAEPQNQSEVTA